MGLNLTEGAQPAVASSGYEGIAILGSHPETKSEAPFDKNWLIYACSPDNTPFGMGKVKGVLPRVDVWFELHRPIAHPTRPYRYLRWLEEQAENRQFTLVMRDGEAIPAFKGVVEYPEAQLKKRFFRSAFVNSIAFIIAKAIVDCEAMGIPNIGVFGVLQQGKEEFLLHRTGVKVMLEEAHRAGLNLVLPRAAAQLLEDPPETW